MASSDAPASGEAAVAEGTNASANLIQIDRPQQADLDRCVHCGLCLNACPTYRELGLEMDSPRGRIYQMNHVAAGALISDSYREHIDLCLACRGCETACPSGVQYGRLVEAARAEIEAHTERPWLARSFRYFIFFRLLQSPTLMTVAGSGLWLYQASGLQRVLRASGILRLLGGLGELEMLSPPAEVPFFFSKIGKTFPPDGERRYRVAFLAGCIANVSFARLNEATVRVLQKNGCEVVIPGSQTCCGALHAHAGIRNEARKLARRNIDAVWDGLGERAGETDRYDAIITNAGGCGSNLKEYHELLEHDPDYREKAAVFVSRMRDINEFLASMDLNPKMGPVMQTVTYQDSCHLAHGQKIRGAPRKLLRLVPGLKLVEMTNPDLCCGSAGIYNVLHTDLALEILKHKMESVNATKAELVASSNPGCMLQIEAGGRLYGSNQQVAHVVQILDEAYQNYTPEKASA